MFITHLQAHHPVVLSEENSLAQKGFRADVTDRLSEMKDLQCLLFTPTEDSFHFSKMWSHSITSLIQHQQGGVLCSVFI